MSVTQKAAGCQVDPGNLVLHGYMGEELPESWYAARRAAYFARSDAEAFAARSAAAYLTTYTHSGKSYKKDSSGGLVNPSYEERVRYIKYRDDLIKRVYYKVWHGAKKPSDDDIAPEDDGLRAESSVRRAAKNIEALALCNEWDWWLTLTLAPGKYETRLDLEDYRRDLTQWLRDQRKKYDTDIAFLLVPELHQDGNGWHMHGFLRELPESALRRFGLDEKLPYRLRDRIMQGIQVWDWPGYSHKWGYCAVERLQDRDKAARYCTKYITKGLYKRDEAAERLFKALPKGANLYFCSRGLARPEVLSDKVYYSTEPLNANYEVLQVYDYRHKMVVDWSATYETASVDWLRPLGGGDFDEEPDSQLTL